MNREILTLVIITCTAAAPTSDDAQAKIIKYENKLFDSEPKDLVTELYSYSFETSNGLKRKETGQLVNGGLPDAHIVVEGEYSYTDPNGEEQYVRYVADAEGYRVFMEKMPESDLTFLPPEVISVPPGVVASLLG